MNTEEQIALLSAVVAFVSMVATIIISIATRIGVRAQIKAAQEQLAEARRQFQAQNDPEVEFKVYVQANPPEQAGVWLKATNHHSTVPVNDLVAYLVGDSPSEKEAYQMTFLVFGDLKPQQTLSERSLQSLDEVLSKHFPDFLPDSALITTFPSAVESSQDFPLKLYYSYMPRYAGAANVSGTKDLNLRVRRKRAD